MKVIDLSTSVWKTELNEDSTISVPSLLAYFRYNIGDLNNLLGTCYNLNTTTLEIVDQDGNEINIDAATIYKYIYLLSFYGRQVRANLGVGGIDALVQATSDGGTLRFIDKTYIAKVYLQLRKDTETTLTRLVNKYKMGHQTAVQVEGDDVFVSPRTFSEYNGGGTLYNRDLF